MDNALIDEQQGPGIGALIGQLPTILWERRWWIIVPAVLGVLAAIAALLLLRPTYESSALMVVQSPQIQDEALAQLNNEVIDRRIARIRAEVVSRPNLISLIERHNLYTDARQTEPLSAIIDRMREAITLEPTTVEVAAPGQQSQTIAFRLAYTYTDARGAQAVTQDLMDRILELDSSGNVEQATNTVQFLTDQATDLEQKITRLQNEITTITSRNGGVLAGATSPIISTGGGGNYDFQIAQLQRDNATLAAQKAEASNIDTRDPNVLAAEARLAALRATYTENHPDVTLAKQQLAQIRALAAQNQRSVSTASFDQQIAVNNAQIAALRAAQVRERAAAGAQLAAQSRAPVVQQQLANLEQELTGLNEQYQDVQQRLTLARAGVKAEDEQIAERLSVVEPPVVPDEPVSPNRLLLLGLCIGGGLALGMALALAMEIFFRPIRDPETLGAIMGDGPLGVVPVIAARHKPPSVFARLRRFRFPRPARA